MNYGKEPDENGVPPDCKGTDSVTNQSNLNVDMALRTTDDNDWSLNISIDTKELSTEIHDLENSNTVNLKSAMSPHRMGCEHTFQENQANLDVNNMSKYAVPDCKVPESDWTLNVTVTSQITDESDWSLHISTTSEEQSQIDKTSNDLEKPSDNDHTINTNATASQPLITNIDSIHSKNFLTHCMSSDSTVQENQLTKSLPANVEKSLLNNVEGVREANETYPMQNGKILNEMRDKMSSGLNTMSCSTVGIAKVVLHRIKDVDFKVEPNLSTTKQDSKLYNVVCSSTVVRAKRAMSRRSYVEPKLNKKLRRDANEAH